MMCAFTGVKFCGGTESFFNCSMLMPRVRFEFRSTARDRPRCFIFMWKDPPREERTAHP